MTQRLVWVALAVVVAAGSAFFALLVYDDRSAPPIIIEDAPSAVDVVVSISGAVATPGLYTLPSGARLNDAITAAGGLRDDADLQSINLAARLDDEEQVDIPFQQPSAQVVDLNTPASFGIRTDQPTAVPKIDSRININTASEADLESLPRIGPALAARIIEYREANGPFSENQELARVDGISPAMVEELSDLITVGS